MIQELDILTECSLFSKIDKQELGLLLSCLGAKKTVFDKNDFIFAAGEPITNVGIILSGSVHILQEDFWGKRNIFARVSTGDLIGETFSCLEKVIPPVSAMSAEKSEILFIGYSKIINSCNSNCSFHTMLIRNIVEILAKNNIRFIEKMGYLTKPNIREKLMSYLSRQAQINKSNSFEITFNRQELADYLSVDRSAMSKELGKMRDDKLISFSKNNFNLINNNTSLGDYNV